MPLRAKSLEEWTEDARIFAQESLDDEDFRLLDTHPKRKDVYRQIAYAGKETYRRMKEMLEKQGHEANDPMIPFDLSREAMLDRLGQEMDRLFPGWLSETKGPDWTTQMREAGLR